MRTRFITAATQVEGFPRSLLPEAAFIGRSNVGKSSLLNTLTGAKIARASQSPGRTQTINFFEAERDGGHVMLADLPGYGFARAPSAVRARFPELIETYLTGRPTLRVALLLLDLRREPDDEDIEVHRWLSERLAPPRATWLVLTKLDKLPKARQKPALLRVAQALGAPADRVFGTSSSTGAGVETLRRRLFGLAALDLGT